MGPQDLLLKVWEILKTDGPPLGLHLNPTKCEWSWLNAECSLPCPLEQVALVPTAEIQMLGVPLGSGDFVSRYVKGKLLDGTIKVMAKLAEFEDPQAAMYLLRLSYGIVRANHFMRTTPLPQWEQVAADFDTLCLRFSAVLSPAILTSKLVCPRRLVVLAFGASWITLLGPSVRVGMKLA